MRGKSVFNLSAIIYFLRTSQQILLHVELQYHGSASVARKGLTYMVDLLTRQVWGIVVL